MKRKILVIASLFVSLFTIKAADIYYYQSQFAACVDSFKMGLQDNASFEQSLKSFNQLQAGLEAETAIAKKEPLLSDIKSVYSFIGEIGPNAKSYSLSLAQKKRAVKILGITETLYNDSVFCLPITKISLWDSTYTCYMIDNKSDSMMLVYKIKYTVQKKFSSYSGFLDAGVSKKSSRGILKSFGNLATVKFEKEKCEEQLQLTKYIQPEVVEPKEEKYPEPDYLSPQQKKALKLKEKEQLKKDKEKAKKQALRDKEKKKRDMDKERAEAKKQELKEREQKTKEMAEARKEKAKEAADSRNKKVVVNKKTTADKKDKKTEAQKNDTTAKKTLDKKASTKSSSSKKSK